MPTEQCAWRCPACGRVNRAIHVSCDRRSHPCSTVGAINAEFRVNDWTSPACFAEVGEHFRIFVSRDACRVCGRAMEDLVAEYGTILSVRDFPQGTVFANDPRR